MRSVLPVLVLAAVFAAGCGPATLDTPAGRAERLSERMTIALGLDAAQEQQARQLALAMEEAQSAWSRQRWELADAVATQLRSDAFNEAPLEALSKARAAELERSRARMINELKAFHQALRPAQRAEAARILQRWMQKIGADV